MMTASQNLISIGRAARQLGVDVDRAIAAAEKIGVVAPLTIDGAPLITREDRERIREHLDQQGNR